MPRTYYISNCLLCGSDPFSTVGVAVAGASGTAMTGTGVLLMDRVWDVEV